MLNEYTKTLTFLICITFTTIILYSIRLVSNGDFEKCTSVVVSNGQTIQRVSATQRPNPFAKYVLLWTPMWYNPPIQYGFTIFETCTVSNCYITGKQNLLPTDLFAAIMFYAPTVGKKIDLPFRRSPDQRYIFCNWDVPLEENATNYHLSKSYNWTMTYRHDSDIVMRYGHFIPRKTNYQLPSEEFVQKKRHSAAWVAYNCESDSKRELLVKELRKHIDVDVYGGCGNFSCPYSKKCYDRLEYNYKFYLAFEEHYCKDFTTANLFRILKRNIVPVVYGAGDYEKITPPHSVINVEDFETVEELAWFLKDLDTARYLQYFQWKRNYTVVRNSASSFCELCRKLHDVKEPKRVYEDVGEWWWSGGKQCRSGESLPKIVPSR